MPDFKSTGVKDGDGDLAYQTINNCLSDVITTNVIYSEENNILINSYSNFGLDFLVKYDDKGNIIADEKNTYEYDEIGQLVSTIGNNSSSYIYDDRSNILTKIVENEITTFSYSNDGWRDQLTSVNGNALTYDANGNLISYDGKEYNWNYGKCLESIVDGNNKYSYTYDENGIRTSKTVNDKTTYYNTQNGVILSQNDGTDTLYFQYDNTGSPIGFVWNGTQYLYLTNQMGDVISITDTNGEIVGNYEYDAWGAVTLSDSNIANINPLRYRGYYFDSETNYYYLQSRYYNPDICRFINADSLYILFLLKNNEKNLNLFAYCNNNPINQTDKFGYIGKIDAAIVIVMFVAYYIVDKVLKLGSDYTVESKNVHIDSMGNYIVKIIYYKSKVNKKSFVLSLGDKASWKNATNINEHLNQDFINNQANYIQSEIDKGDSTSLTNDGPDVLGIQIASATVAIYLIAQKITVSIIKAVYNKVWGTKRVINWNANETYLFNIAKGGSTLNGWYAYKYTDGSVKKI